MKERTKLISIILLLAFLIASCAPAAQTSTLMPAPTSTPARTPTVMASPTQLLDAQQYLSEALDIIQNNAFYSDKVDWPQVREIAFMYENNARTPVDTYDSINFALKQLGDNHSFLVTPEIANQSINSTVADYPAPIGKLLGDKIGYIAVFDFNAQAREQGNKYADNIQNLIIELDKQSVCGWIVDLHENPGGNMYPMIAGLGALIGEGDLGSFKDATGQTTPWYYRDGQAGEGNLQHTQVSHPEFLFDPDETPIAVIIGPQTASAGEATAISFRGRPNTRFFGKPSGGFTTANEVFTLSDGALIVLSVAIELDRNGQEYGGKIVPDVDTLNAEAEAIDWLLAQPACDQ